MAVITDIRTSDAGLWHRLTAGIQALRTRRAQHRLYQETLNELRALSARELDDLGINRSMIGEVAYQAAYGK